MMMISLLSFGINWNLMMIQNEPINVRTRHTLQTELRRISIDVN